ncbi:MAG: hypothetical protein R3E21_07960 [Caenibius sp.]
MTWLLIFATYVALSMVLAFWLRHRAPIFQRLNDVNWLALVLIDISVAFCLFGLLYILSIYQERPDPRETLSSVVGRHAIAGKRWATWAASAIDWIFLILTSQRDHCLKEALKHMEKSYGD